MHRFRKRLDGKRNAGPDFQAPSHSDAAPSLDQQQLQLDFLPSTDDFRTSLILPDLSRRFSLLRTPAGDPVTIDDLRSKFAEQRAKGAENTISEEEEDMLLETLGKWRRRNSGGHVAASVEQSADSSFTATSDSGHTEESGSNSSTTIKLTEKGGGGSSSASTSTTSSPGKSKRYSNNLFGSNRLRDYTYLRGVSSSRTSAGGSSKAGSITQSEDSTSNSQFANTSSFADSLASSSPPTDSNADESVMSLSSANDQGSVRSASSSVSEGASGAEFKAQKTLGPAGLKRASMALESVIKEIEDDVEEEIVMPRSTPIPKTHTDPHVHQSNGHLQPRQLGEGFIRESNASMLSSVIEAGMAISSDKSPEETDHTNAQRGPSPVPLGHVPGYIPGMPRPMTPRDFESFDEQRSHSTTPRATSPTHGSFTLTDGGSVVASISNILRRESVSSRQSPRPITPLFLNRSPHGAHYSIPSGSQSGGYTPMDDDRSRLSTDLNNGHSSFDYDGILGSSILGGRRRPASPLSNPPFHGISAMSTSPQSTPSRPMTPSRPTTPSNIIWGVRPDASVSPQSSLQGGSHSRNNSWASEGDSDTYGSGGGETDDDANMRLGIKPPKIASGSPRVLRSPPHSDSPGPEKGQLSRSWTLKASQAAANAARLMSPMNGEFAQHQISPSQHSNHRSLTPTQNAPRSPGSPTFEASSRSARRSSRQNGYVATSPFNLGPLPTLALNPRANMSSSSLESDGSSFHSWEDDKDKLLNLFNDAEVQPPWHAISSPSSSGKSSTTSGANGLSRSTSRTSPEEDWDPEDIVKGYAGLKRADFAMIHDKLVTVAKSTEHRGSALRKRRPSTSQSNYSIRGDTRVASPPPPSSPTANIFHGAREQQQMQVLNSCLDQQPLVAPVMALSNSSSSFDRPNRNLAQVLFGQEEEGTGSEIQINSPPVATSPEKSDASKSASVSPPISEQSVSSPDPDARPVSPNTSVRSPPATPSAFSLNRNPSSARLPPATPEDQAALTLEVQQKVEAATAALRKRPSQEGLTHSSSISRKRIDPSQISKPLLVSSSTSVDTIPLKTPALSASNGTGTSKIGSRFKKLRGSLRVKNMVTPEEPATPATDSKTPTTSQTAQYDVVKLKSTGPPSVSSATDARFKVSVPSPPASAGPGLKGFMARFRTKRATDIPQSSSSSISSDHHPSPLLPVSPLSPLGHTQRQVSSSSTLSRTPSQKAPSESGHTPTTARPDQHRNQFSPPSSPLPVTSETPEPDDSDAIHQLFAAATNLGIDQGALNDLLKRSGSLTSKTLLNPGNGTTPRGSPPSVNPHGQQHLTVPPIQHPNLSSSSGSDYTATPGMFNSSPVSDLSVGNNFSYKEEALPIEDSSAKPPAKRAEPLRRARDVGGEANPVVRRTLIFADPRQSTVDPAGLRRNKSRRRASVQSNSSRSIHDRVPTPPPSKTPQHKRFSHEASPPVPQLPHALGGPPDNLLSTPAGHLEKSNSAAYDSLYELYGDSRSASVMADRNQPDFGRGDPPIDSETATGVEVIQLANGDIIWNVVNGLRDEDDESLYAGRNSIGSEYSTRESSENMQVFVKEHGRSSSKGSQASFMSRKRIHGGKSRPETKVLYGSSEQIGRLIESVSQGMDAGSFNFAPYAGYTTASNPSNHTHAGGHGHSATSSLSTNDWAINEIDNILTSINANSSRS